MMSRSTFLGFGKSTCYDFINSVRHTSNSKSSANSSNKLDRATCSSSDCDNILSFNPRGGEGGDENGENESMVEEQVLFKQSNESS